MEALKKKYQRKVTDIHALHYFNADGEKITVFSPYDVMVKEMISLGTNPIGKTIKELQTEISQICLDNYMDLNFGEDSIPDSAAYSKSNKFQKNAVITHHLKALYYWLYDFNPSKMSDSERFDFELYQKR